MATTIHFTGTRQEAKALAYRLGAILAGREADSIGIGRGLLLAMGVAALSDIKDAFVTKARGGTDEMGISWPKLSRKYLAYGRRFGRGEQSALTKAAGLNPRANRLAPGNNKGLLTADQLKRWRMIFARSLARFLLSMEAGEAKAAAAQIAWAQLKREGAQTKLNVFGSRQVEILRDTGVLLNSLSPGVLSGPPGPNQQYRGPSGPGGDQQIFDLTAGKVIVGTNVFYARAHQEGGRKMPRRQFLPENEAQIPDVWWQRWLAVGIKAVEVGAALLYRKGAA